jgi:hypothetical protein
MTHDTEVLTSDPAAVAAFDTAAIPVPRFGKHYDLYVAEVFDGRHGCLDAPVDL